MEYLSMSEIKNRISRLNEWLTAHEDDHYIASAIKHERAWYENHLEEMEDIDYATMDCNCPTQYFSMIQNLEI